MIRIFILLFMLGISLQVIGQAHVKTRQIQIKKGQTYLNLPVDPSLLTVRAYIKSNGKDIARFNIKLAEKPTFWVFYDVSDYQGKTLRIEIENVQQRGVRGGQPNTNVTPLPELDTKGLDLIFADSKFPGQESVYQEMDRPQVHFSSQRGWINDPNGLVYYKGEYHMYYQHNPYGWENGNKHWGHAVSTDLLHWKEFKTAIFPVLDLPDGRNDSAFSGSATYDSTNTSGFRENGIDPLIVFYTSTGRGECIKLSYDNGRTFIDYPGNPVVEHNGRDPKVFWYEPGNHWVLIVWDSGVLQELSNGETASVRQHSIYTSSDLKNWTYQSGVSGFFECPELFELPVEGVPGLSKWVMYDAHGRYIVGDFTGKEFKIEQHFTKYENGGGYFYASQTFNNTPDARRIQVGWGRGITQPGMPFNQALLFPTELTLRKTFNGYRLCPTPIEEIKTLHGTTQRLENRVVSSGESIGLTVDPNAALHVIAEIERGDAPITLNILGYELRHDNEWAFVTTPPANADQNTQSPSGPFPPKAAATPVIYVPSSNIFKIEAIVDKNILEFFINNGELYYVTEFNGGKTGTIEASIAEARRGGPRKFILKSLEVSELTSIWAKENR